MESDTTLGLDYVNLLQENTQQLKTSSGDMKSSPPMSHFQKDSRFGLPDKERHVSVEWVRVQLGKMRSLDLNF